MRVWGHSFLLSPLSPPWTPEGPTACPPRHHVCLGCDEVPPGLWRPLGLLIFIMSELLMLSGEGFVYVKYFPKVTVIFFLINIYIVKNLGNWFVSLKLSVSPCVSLWI